jgi:hypothetical protein
MKCFLLCLVAASAAASQKSPFPDSIRDRMNEVRGFAVQAYEDLLSTSPGASGTVNVSFMVLPDGTAGEVAATGNSELAPVMDKLEEAIAALEFEALPEGSEPMRISVPFIFMPPAN